MLDRALIATPAWNDLGVQAWAAYSRHADLGTGNIVYPIEGILTWIVIFAMAASYLRSDRTVARKAARPVSLAAVGALGWIGTTIIAAPVMQSVRHLGSDPVALHHAFNVFTLWGVYVRDAFTGLTFLACIWTVIEVFRAPHAGNATSPVASASELVSASRWLRRVTSSG
ncbi:hypothetical protein OG895_18170 [Streptomyces sp. NBC_00201]|uniref:hypothetical protein n=1 Tax=Streptomyces sp. NBC_00201 TaxID=2975679 RepID=UPI00225011E8|nr:hypothetical protein [Streptomyces sp. NBC_00201]MCX5247128.1 hypothetical protein [Streptomyces sp. NBC_00201]